jgi:hypothetical protein
MEPDTKTPYIDLNNKTGELLFSGRSIPENAARVYEGVLEWVNTYKKNPRRITNLRIDLEYFNTASTLWLAKIVQSLSSIKNKSCTLMIHLYFSIDEFERMEADDLKDELNPIMHLIDYTEISVGIKIYGTSDDEKVLKEAMVLF